VPALALPATVLLPDLRAVPRGLGPASLGWLPRRLGRSRGPSDLRGLASTSARGAGAEVWRRSDQLETQTERKQKTGARAAGLCLLSSEIDPEHTQTNVHRRVQDGGR